jgi:tartrate-resistant acid phosphatase type 5
MMGKRFWLALAALGHFACIEAAPLSAAPGEVSFVVVGDWGTGSDDQHSVAKQMAVASRAIGARFVISTGDNIYPRGLKAADDSQFQTKFEMVYDDPALRIPWYVVLGNHDRAGDAEAEIDHASTNGRWRLPSAYYKHSEALGAGNSVDFFFIDTDEIRERYRSWVRYFTRDPQLVWLEQELSNSRAEWKIVVGHHPVYSGGRHGGEPALVRRLEPLLEKYGVQVYLNGHDHDLEHRIAGGIHYLTSGAGARTRPAKPREGAQFFAARPGFMTARLQPTAMEIEFLDLNGTTLYRAHVERDSALRRGVAPTH